MGDSIILPSLSNDMVLTIFKYLVDAELRKHLSGSLGFRAGCQEGVIATLEIMFGAADDFAAEQAYEKKESWLHICERIVDEKLSFWVEEIYRCNENSDFNIDFEQMIHDTNQAVDEFALEHPMLLLDALRCL